MWQAIELREIRVFLALAEELHFGRAAERVGLTQSRVSQSVRALERKLGVQLAQRTSRRVTLTVAGQRFRDEIGVALGDLEGVLRATGVHVEPVRLGVTNPAAISPRVRAMIAAYEAGGAGRSVEVVGLPFGDRFGPLRRREVDVMMTGLPLDQPDLATSPVLDREPRMLAVARDHALAARESVSVEELADYRVGNFDITLPPEQLEELVPPVTPSGRPIRIHETAEILLAVATGQIVHPVTAIFAAIYRPPDVAYVPIHDMAPSRAVLAWLKGRRHPGLREFLSIAHHTSRD